MSDGRIPDISSADITRSTRDRVELHDRLQDWMRGHHAGATVTELQVPSNGMSSETVLFDASWPDDRAPAGRGGGRFVLRLEPPAEAVPVFPSYDLDAQQRVMRHVAATTGAPAPEVCWYEDDRSVLGGTFFVMVRVEGRVPPDVLPYTMDGYVLGLSASQRRRMQDATVDVLTRIHTAPIDASTAYLELAAAGDTALRRHVGHWRSYHDWVCGGRSIPVLDEAARWLEAHWPQEADARPPVLSWGDARVGNVMYGDDGEPVAVLDWEMAAVAPREVDLAWMSFLHTFFQDITEEMGMPGLPDMLLLDDVAQRYASTSGVEPLELAWFEVYAAYRHGVIMARVHDRQVHFGEAQPVTEPDDAVMHHQRLRRLIAR